MRTSCYFISGTWTPSSQIEVHVSRSYSMVQVLPGRARRSVKKQNQPEVGRIRRKCSVLVPKLLLNSGSRIWDSSPSVRASNGEGWKFPKREVSVSLGPFLDCFDDYSSGFRGHSNSANAAESFAPDFKIQRSGWLSAWWCWHPQVIGGIAPFGIHAAQKEWASISLLSANASSTLLALQHVTWLRASWSCNGLSHVILCLANKEETNTMHMPLDLTFKSEAAQNQQTWQNHQSNLVTQSDSAVQNLSANVRH